MVNELLFCVRRAKHQMTIEGDIERGVVPPSEVLVYERKRRRQVFTVQVILSAVVALFSMLQLSLSHDCVSKSIFLPLLVGLLGYWMPQPRA